MQLKALVFVRLPLSLVVNYVVFSISIMTLKAPIFMLHCKFLITITGPLFRTGIIGRQATFLTEAATTGYY
jgi:hypothetical protein